MRDINRIPKILDRLQVIWERYPDMRLGQLIGNVFPCTPDTQIDMFFFNDEMFISILEKFYSKDRTFRIGGKDSLKKIIDEIKAGK